MGVVIRFIIFLFPFIKEILFSDKDEADYSIFEKIKRKFVLFIICIILIYNCFVSMRLYTIATRDRNQELLLQTQAETIKRLTQEKEACAISVTKTAEVLHDLYIHRKNK